MDQRYLQYAAEIEAKRKAQAEAEQAEQDRLDNIQAEVDKQAALRSHAQRLADDAKLKNNALSLGLEDEQHISYDGKSRPSADTMFSDFYTPSPVTPKQTDTYLMDAILKGIPSWNKQEKSPINNLIEKSLANREPASVPSLDSMEKASLKTAEQGGIVSKDIAEKPISVESEPQSKVELRDREMEAALRNKYGGLLSVGLGRAASKVGHAIAGVKEQGDYFGDAEKLAGAGEEFVKETRKSTLDKFNLQDTAELRDPASELSKQFRETTKEMLRMNGLESIAAKIPESASASFLQKTFPQFTNIINAKMAQESKKEQTALMAEAKKESQKSKEDSKNQDFVERQAKQITTSKEYERYNKVNDAKSKIEAVLSKGNKMTSADDIAAIYEFIKGLDPESAVREGETDLARSGMSALSNVQLSFSKLGNNPRILTPQFISNIKKYMDIADKTYADKLNKRVDLAKQLGKSRGIAEDSQQPLEFIRPTQKIITTDPKIEEYAKQYNLSYEQAKQVLTSRGYKTGM